MTNGRDNERAFWENPSMRLRKKHNKNENAEEYKMFEIEKKEVFFENADAETGTMNTNTQYIRISFIAKPSKHFVIFFSL